MAMAFVFGSSPAIAGFMVAFRFANVIRRLFGEGNLPAGFIPHFEDIRMSCVKKSAQFFRDLFFSLAIVLIFLIGAIDLGLYFFWKMGDISADTAQILYLTLLMMPGILFICLFGLSSALLQCEKHFFLSGFAPVGFNVVWVSAVLWLKGREPSLAVVHLSVAIVAAFLAQFLLTLPRLFGFMRRSLTWRESFSPHLFSPELKKVALSLLLSVVGVGAMQINSALDALFARYACLEGPAYLWYAIRIEQLPLALFGIALSSALMPSLSRAMKNQELIQFSHLLRFALKRSFSLLFPCSFGLFVLGAAGLNLLYGRGVFSEQTTQQTLLCLWGYAIGLVPSVFTLLCSSALYAAKEYRIPTLGCVQSVGVNCALNALFVFVFHWGALSVALSTSLSALYNAAYLLRHLKKRCDIFLFDRDVRTSFFKTMLSTLMGALLTLLVGQFFLKDPTLSVLFGKEQVTFARHAVEQLVQFLALSGIFGSITLLYAWMTNAEDILALFRLRKRVGEKM